MPTYGIELRQPVNAKAEEIRTLGLPDRYEGPAVRIETLKGVLVAGRSQVIDETGILPISYQPGKYHERRSPRRIARAIERARVDPEALTGERLLVTDWWSANYYHWICDVLPRLEALIEAGVTGELLLPAELADLPFVRVSLEAYPEYAWRYFGGGGRAVHVETLMAPSHTAHNGFQHPVLAPRAFKRLKAHFGVRDTKTPKRRIHVTRANVRTRKLVNEAEVSRALAAHGFETIDFDELDLAGQIALMAEAKVIAGPHGAGLTNMAFMPPGGAVIEMRHLAGPSNCYITLAGICGHDHFLAASSPPEAGEHLHAANIEVTPEKLEAVLVQVEEWLAAK